MDEFIKQLREFTDKLGAIIDGLKLSKFTVSTVSDTITVEVKTDQDLAPTGRKCPECGAHNLVKRDGCDQCENCGYKGSCG